MPQKSHWPFGNEAQAQGGRGSHLPREEERERAKQAQHAALRQMMRHDRLIVGGRAHTKKHGLS
jgi:hypothetical protein